jgi:hypothetical protein
MDYGRPGNGYVLQRLPGGHGFFLPLSMRTVGVAKASGNSSVTPSLSGHSPPSRAESRRDRCLRDGERRNRSIQPILDSEDHERVAVTQYGSPGEANGRTHDYA